jgi:hypothetical protein
VVIAADGLVLTIGYLILEADQVQLVTDDGGASRRAWWPTTWPPASAWCGAGAAAAGAGALGRAGAARPERAADGGQRG